MIYLYEYCFGSNMQEFNNEPRFGVAVGDGSWLSGIPSDTNEIVACEVWLKFALATFL